MAYSSPRLLNYKLSVSVKLLGRARVGGQKAELTWLGGGGGSSLCCGGRGGLEGGGGGGWLGRLLGAPWRKGG